MTKRITILFSIIAGLVVGTPALAQTLQDTNQQPTVYGPNLVDTRPDDGTVQKERPQSAVIELQLYADRGRTVDAKVESLRTIESLAPKVYARRGGDWKVSIIGDREASFVVNDPATDVEIENPRGAKSPFSEVTMKGYFSTTLVFPLYGRKGESLGASEIEIVDTLTGRTLLRTTIP